MIQECVELQPDMFKAGDPGKNFQNKIPNCFICLMHLLGTDLEFFNKFTHLNAFFFFLFICYQMAKL